MLKHRLNLLAVAALALLLHAASAADTIRSDRFTTATLPLDRELQFGSYIVLLPPFRRTPRLVVGRA